MGPVANPELVTPAISFQTNVPLQPHDSVPANTETIDVSVCSEFKQYTMPATTLDAMHKPFIVLDGEHQPMIFMVGKDARSYCIRHVSGGDSWTSYDITPAGENTRVSVLDVFQHHTGEVAISLVVTTPASLPGIPSLYYAKPFNVSTTGFSPSDIVFAEIKNEKSVQIVSMKISAPDTGKKDPDFIIVGTVGTSLDRGTDYIVPTDPANQTPWTAVSLPENAKAVLKVTPATQIHSIDGCVVSLYKQELSVPSPPLNAADVGTAISCLSLNGKINIFLLLEKLGGGARDVSTTITSKGLSDLYVAGVKGIGYYQSERMSDDPHIILSDISFLQVVASENALKVSVFALSTDQELYYIEGGRDSANHTPVFTWSAYPIRKDVNRLSTQYNAAVNACEAIYVDSAGQLKHIWRDFNTKMWSEQSIHVSAMDKVVSYPAFVSQIHLQGSQGSVIGNGRKVMLSASEVAYVRINEKAHRLDRNPVAFTADSSGYIRIVIQTGAQLASPTITATLNGDEGNYSFPIEPRQRVFRKFSKVQSGDSIKNAKSTAGGPVFPPGTNIDDATFDNAAKLLKQVPNIISHVDPSASSMLGSDVIDGSPNAGDVEWTHQASSSGFSYYSIWDWMEGAVHSVAHVLGDLIESVGQGLRKIAQWGIKVVGKVVNFFAEVAGKALRWVLDSVGSVIRNVATFLKDTLGIDITRYIAWLGFIWDYDNILNTQKIIFRSAQEGAELLQDIATENASWMKQYIKNSRSFISSYIKPPENLGEDNIIKDAKASFANSFFGKLLQKILDNPIIHEVMRYASLWLLEAISLLEEEISFPGIGDLEKLLEGKFTELLGKLLDDAAEGLLTFVKDLFNGFGGLVSGKRSIGDVFSVIFSDAFWSIFDATQDVALALIDIISDIVAGCLKIVTGRIKLPGISAFWESFTKTNFSFLDVGAMIMAQVMYLVTMMWQEKLPFEVMEPWYNLLPKKGSVHFPPIESSENRHFSFVKMTHQVTLTDSSGTPEEYAAFLGVLIDSSCGWVSAIASMVGSACEITTLGKNIRVEGFDLANFRGGGVSSSSPSITPKRTALPCIQSIQLACTCIGFIMKTASTFNASRLPATSTRTKASRVFKYVSLSLSGIALLARAQKKDTAFTRTLPAAGDIISAFPGGVWTFVDSQKGGADWLVFATAMTNTVAGGCDIGTIILGATDMQAEAWIPFFVSLGLNIAQLGTTITYGIEYVKPPKTS